MIIGVGNGQRPCFSKVAAVLVGFAIELVKEFATIVNRCPKGSGRGLTSAKMERKTVASKRGRRGRWKSP